MTTTGSVAVGGSAVGNFQEAIGSSDSDWIRPTTPLSFWHYFDHDWFRVTFDAGKTYRVDIKRLLDRSRYAPRHPHSGDLRFERQPDRGYCG